ncbi:hypothetical protein QTG54_005219 [Skeletonema marinoi]|uniref:Uncharacterized protein n=1 Tax=Skeletonema marinoi TaxID=267567 RepID=A0AAD9DDS5_9STRA|nr:hypothetical protein QTG54_005219 [Skeletonema marinoi]
MEAFLSESTEAAPSAELIPEPRFFSIGNVNLAEEWNHGATAVTAANDGTIKFYAPADTKVGDTLFLFLSRTDGLLPLRIDQWSRGAECFKSFNRQDSCFRAADCVKRDGPYCLEFDEELGGGNGRDLGTVVFYRHVTEDDPGCWTVELPGKTTVWAIVTAIQGVNRDRPIFRTSGTSCDAEWESEFPSVYGKENDVLLLSQCFDDTALKRHFQPPEGTELLGFTNSVDEAGFLFGKRLEETGMSGKLITGGRGGPKCKDALVSLVVNRE